MAALQKFKLFATHCAVSGSPTRSPTTSPVIHLRRKKTLRMLLGRAAGGRRLQDEGSPDHHRRDSQSSDEGSSSEKAARNKLKDLFVSSPPALGERASENVRERLLTTSSASDGGVRGTGYRSLRPLSATFRQRLMRRAWRPVLVAIPE
ncbi:hypothetical protein F511_13336 [Dorcoceras hygrometricum]|uniref:Uncharacterized protein n=1 Tax=Dorcoceras hygrometricum TaxID=472368 RepID=A0A2Z7C699_9LAMI|nr:hypothetical protein F511_13336 [Dorcoceras hygrometricum]